MSKQYVTKKLTVTFRVSRMEYTLDLPAGLRCVPIEDEPARGRPQFFLDEFPVQIFPRDSFVYHDAKHYGVRLSESEVEEA